MRRAGKKSPSLQGDIYDEQQIQPLPDNNDLPQWLYDKMDDVRIDASASMYHTNMDLDGDNAVFRDLFSESGNGSIAGSQFSPSSSSSFSSQSMPGSEHSYGNESDNMRKTRKNRASIKKPATRSHGIRVTGMFADEDIDEDEDNDGMTHAEEINKETKKEKTFNFDGRELEMGRMMTGLNIKSTELDKRMIELLERDDEAHKGAVDVGSAELDRRYRNIMAVLSNEVDVDEKEGEVYGMGRCKLCSHCSIRSIEEEEAFRSTYDMICDYDIEKYGYVPDCHLFKEMAALFNIQQDSVKRNGGNYFWITAREVRDHFVFHDMNNPLRIIGTELLYLREILQEGRSHLIGSTGKRKFWNGSKTKIYMSVLKEYKALYREYITYRHQINMHTMTQKMRAAPKKAKNVPSRHLNGAVPPGRFSLPFVVNA